jgi:V/A-type H+-transporting ATPase subunit I
MRPVNATWFELLSTHDELADTLEALAHTGSIELEVHDHSRMQMDLQDLQLRLQEYTKLERYYKSWWPEPDTSMSPFSGSPVEILDVALASIYKWEIQIQPSIQRLEVAKSLVTDLLLLRELLMSDAMPDLDYKLLTTSGPIVSARLFLVPPKSRLENIPQTVLWKEYSTAEHEFLLLVGTVDDLSSLTPELAIKKNTHVHMPPLPARKQDAVRMIGEKQARLSRYVQRLQKEIEEHAVKYHLAQALGEIRKMDWLLKNVSSLPASNNFAWVTGWTSDRSGNSLRRSLSLQGVRAIMHFPDAPEDVQPPLMLQNPWWAKPFEFFAGALGTPGRDETDPSQLLAIIAPLLFGYMFGDVGQGLVLLLAGLLLQKRWPLSRILVANGASAMAFGFVFGSMFGREDLVPALWVHPVESPLPVLAIPMFAGVLIILLGLALNALQSSWRGQWLHWLCADAPILVLYLIIITAFTTPLHVSLMVLASALTWFVIGNLLLEEGRILRALAAIGSLVETLIQLVLNTVSFVRVGAFALAHAGLSMAFVIMADNAGSFLVSLLIMLLGNVIVIVLEGLVVSIQTTRLILFEFFIRFLRADGRVFKPLTGPVTDTAST